MLLQLGAVQFNVLPFNTNEMSHSARGDYAEHQVVGAKPPLEWVGEGSEEWSIAGEVFPKRFGGLTELEALQAMRRSGQPQFMLRGDGTPMGWVAILEVQERSSMLARDGVGRVVRFDVKVKSAQAPGADGLFSALVDLLS